MVPRVVVTGVGGAPGFDLARSLMRRGCTVIGTDSDPLASGLLLPLAARVVPPADHPDYPTQLLTLCTEFEADALLSTVEAELPHLLRLCPKLTALGVRTWLPSTGAVTACLDKAVFHSVLVRHGLPTPNTFLPHQLAELPGDMALVVKPRRGQGAKDVYYCNTPGQARVLCELVTDPIVQEHVVGEEFTADCLVDDAGRASAILRRRLLVRNGLSMVSTTFHDEAVALRVKEVLAAVGMVGPCCVQGFRREIPGGEAQVVITEMNARVAGAFPLSEAAGADLVGQALNGLFGAAVDHTRLGYRSGVQLTKYVETLASGDAATLAKGRPRA
ncbi:ATP-grasp domain-containing protein [Streptomyces sp. 3MP-14]|uniref:ATP-grasp domain-containing protein n=1 Tax=Streptomyces mimosae TaxID=2586635 RepID=A0A5N6AIE2_9ACTN|nr:ATP-grasp domain-containing protein [Streptomyces mimosae]KAB8177702.1 ATP-grasp domain-containing protein [Streptomyces sp. 3MP-14]